MKDFFSAVSPGRTLQTHPDIILAMHAPEDRGRRARLEFPKEDPAGRPEPIGPAVALMVATGDRWVKSGTRRAKVGQHLFEVGPDEEQIVVFEDPKSLGELSVLEIRVYDLPTMEGQPFPDAAQRSVVYRGRASRLTKWGAVTEADGALSDGKRGLRIATDGGPLRMDWWHVARSSVFYEMDALRRKSVDPFIRAILSAEGQGPSAAGGWFQARTTLFEPLDP